MNWLARLKHMKNVLAPNRQNLQKEEMDGSAGFVGDYPEPFQNKKLGPEELYFSPDDILLARLSLFTDRGLSLEDAQMTADRLVERDRELDDRNLCLECSHLSGTVHARRCSQWRIVGEIGGPAIPAELVGILQRCAGFHSRLEMKKL